MPLIDRQALSDTDPKPPPVESESPAAPASANGANAHLQVGGEKVAASLRSCKGRESEVSHPRRQTATILKLRPDLAKARRRVSELHRLVAFRRAYGVELGEREAWARLIAEACAQEVREPDILHFQKKARLLGLKFDPDLAVEKLRAVCRERAELGAAWRAVGSERAGQALGVTAEERETCDIRTLGAVDETKAARAVRLAGERRERDRLRKRLARAEGKKLRAEKVAREVDAAVSQSASTHLKRRDLQEGRRDLRLAPWEAMGLSRATWFRRRKAGLEAARRELSEIGALPESGLPCPSSGSENLTEAGRSHSGKGLGLAAFEAEQALTHAVLHVLGLPAIPWESDRRAWSVRDVERRNAARQASDEIGTTDWRTLRQRFAAGRLSLEKLRTILAAYGVVAEGARAAA